MKVCECARDKEGVGEREDETTGVCSVCERGNRRGGASRLFSQRVISDLDDVRHRLDIAPSMPTSLPLRHGLSSAGQSFHSTREVQTLSEAARPLCDQ